MHSHGSVTGERDKSGGYEAALVSRDGEGVSMFRLADRVRINKAKRRLG